MVLTGHEIWAHTGNAAANFISNELETSNIIGGRRALRSHEINFPMNPYCAPYEMMHNSAPNVETNDIAMQSELMQEKKLEIGNYTSAISDAVTVASNNASIKGVHESIVFGNSHTAIDENAKRNRLGEFLANNVGFNKMAYKRGSSDDNGSYLCAENICAKRSRLHENDDSDMDVDISSGASYSMPGEDIQQQEQEKMQEHFLTQPDGGQSLTAPQIFQEHSVCSHVHAHDMPHDHVHAHNIHRNGFLTLLGRDGRNRDSGFLSHNKNLLLPHHHHQHHQQLQQEQFNAINKSPMQPPPIPTFTPTTTTIIIPTTATTMNKNDNMKFLDEIRTQNIADDDVEYDEFMYQATHGGNFMRHAIDNPGDDL